MPRNSMSGESEVCSRQELMKITSFPSIAILGRIQFPVHIYEVVKSEGMRIEESDLYFQDHAQMLV